ncbi:hypothetical protein CRYUN_Cryun09bG0173400 [Craigia yunnanensis]
MFSVELEQVAELEIARKMVIVGMWCIQTEPGLRPSMSKTVSMLEGDVDNLKFPPNPFPCISSCQMLHHERDF